MTGRDKSVASVGGRIWGVVRRKAHSLCVARQTAAGVSLAGEDQVARRHSRRNSRGLCEQFLPAGDVPRPVEHRNSQYAVYAACMRGGLQPDLLSDAGWWPIPLWQYAVFALVNHSQVAAERRALPVKDIARDRRSSRP